MIDYQSFQYIFPPRPKNNIPSSDLNIWDNGTMVAQPKINGSNCTIYTNGNEVYVFNRHGQRMSNFDINKSEILNFYRGKGWMVLNGEYMNKSQKDQNREVFNHKFCLFDILVLDGNYLVGTTFQQRVGTMDMLYGTPKDFIGSISENCFRIKSYDKGFVELYNSFLNVDMVEGLVLKRKNAKLEVGTSENNNSKSQIKVRKKCNLYKF